MSARSSVHRRRRLMGIAACLGGLGIGVALAAPPTTAAPTGPSAPAVIDRLQNQGYTVIVNRTGGLPMESCSVRSVRPGQTHQTVDSRGGGSLATTVISDTVFVDLAC
jgi:hypothetical protein